MARFDREFKVPLVTGEIAGSATAAVCPTRVLKAVKFKATLTNAGKVYIGTSSSVTKAAGTSTTTAGWELSPGEETDLLLCSNLNQFYIICDNATDDLVYMGYP
jgi:hypothetical protein